MLSIPPKSALTLSVLSTLDNFVFEIIIFYAVMRTNKCNIDYNCVEQNLTYFLFENSNFFSTKLKLQSKQVTMKNLISTGLRHVGARG
jgi:membrane-bound inhibitor of C-type lysozyme